MSLSVGIVGLPNVGKSTLFNALLKKQQAYVANFLFATIEPNIGVVPVPDSRLAKLAEVVANELSPSTTLRVSLPPEVPAVVQFVDIAGLIAGASKGEGLGNKFLAHIRETDAICHVVRAFSDPNIIKQGVSDPKSDFETVEMELKLADLQTLENQSLKIKNPPAGRAGQNDNLKFKNAVEKLTQGLSQGKPAREVELDDQEKLEAKQLSLLTAKPILVVLNIDEGELVRAQSLELSWAEQFGVNAEQVIAISAKVESELAELAEAEQLEYLKGLGVEKSGLERLIKKAFATLGLITFLTAGEKEVRAWTIKNGSTALEAAGVIHSDFMKKFIKADICSFEDFVNIGGWKSCRDQGKVRSEGKDYIIKDGEVVEFKIGA